MQTLKHQAQKLAMLRILPTLLFLFWGSSNADFEEIRKLPGIGTYTANALLALVYNQPFIPFDGNVRRVFSRLFNTVNNY